MRIALKIVANTVQSLPRLNSTSNKESSHDAFSKISSVFDSIIRLATYTDQKVVNHAVQSITRIANWVSKDTNLLNELFSPHLKPLVGLLTSLIEAKYSASNALVFSQVF